MSKKFLVIGLNTFGSTVLKELHARGYEVVGCDKDPSTLEQWKEHADVLMAGDATEDAFLQEIDIQSFDSIVVSNPNDFESLIITTAKLKKNGCNQVIVHCNDRFRGEILSGIIGADQIVYPEEEAGLRVAVKLTEINREKEVDRNENST